MPDTNSSKESTSALATLLTESRYRPSERIDELSTTEMLQVMNAADHEVVVYQASQFRSLESMIHRVPLGELGPQHVTAPGQK